MLRIILLSLIGLSVLVKLPASSAQENTHRDSKGKIKLSKPLEVVKDPEVAENRSLVSKHLGERLGKNVELVLTKSKPKGFTVVVVLRTRASRSNANAVSQLLGQEVLKLLEDSDASEANFAIHTGQTWERKANQSVRHFGPLFLSGRFMTPKKAQDNKGSGKTKVPGTENETDAVDRVGRRVKKVSRLVEPTKSGAR